jgi:hypothetical protein
MSFVSFIVYQELQGERYRQERDAGVLRADLTPGDLFWADVANGLALREMPEPRREDYDRRTRHFLDGLRPR